MKSPVIDPLALVVVLMASRFGYVVGVGTGFLAAAFQLKMGDGPVLALLGARPVLVAAFTYMALGVMVGLVGDIARLAAQAAKEESRRHRENFEAMAQRHRVLLDAKEAVDRRIVGQVQTVASLYESARELEGLDPTAVGPGMLRLLKRFLEVEAAAIYTYDGEKLVLGDVIGEVPEGRSATLPVSGFLGEVVLGREAMPNPAPEKGGILLAAPLTHPDGRVRAVMTIERLPFSRLTPSTHHMMSLLADWASRALVNSEAYAKARDRQRDHPVTGIHQLTYMADRLAQEWSTARRYKLPLAVILVRQPALANASREQWEKGAFELANLLKTRVRNIDVLGHHRTPDTLLMVLPVTPVMGARILGGRLANAISHGAIAVGGNDHQPEVGPTANPAPGMGTGPLPGITPSRLFVDENGTGEVEDLLQRLQSLVFKATGELEFEARAS